MRSSFFENLSTFMYPSNLLHHFGVNGKVSGSIGAVGEISDAVVILHGPRGCGYHYRNSARRRHQPFYPLFSTDMTEAEIISGGTEKLRNVIVDTYNRRRPGLVVVVPTPISDILNEDMDAVIRKLREEQHIPVIAVRSELFSHRDKQYASRRLREISKQPVTGSKNLEMELLGCGFTEVLYALAEQWMEPCPTILRSINIETLGWGFEGSLVLREIEAFLRICGICVNCRIPSASPLTLKRAPAAQLNVVKRVRWAKKMKERFGTEYIHLDGAGRHHGLPGIRRFYEDIAEPLRLTEKMHACLDAAEKRVLAETEGDRAYLSGVRCALVCGSIQMAPHILRQYVRDYGFRVEHVFLILTPENRRDMNIDDELLEKLTGRVEEVAASCSPVKIHLNASDEHMREVGRQMNVMIGSNDITLAGLGVPVIPAVVETTSLSFESYVRSVKRMRQRVESSTVKPDLLLGHMNFSSRDYPLIGDADTIASREMWSRMWLHRKDGDK